MPTAKAAYRVTGYESCPAAPRRYNRRASEVERATGNANLRQSCGLIYAIANAEIDWIERRIRQSGAGKAIHTETQFVDALPEGMCFVERKELMQRYYLGSEAGNGGPLHPGLQIPGVVSAVI